MPRFTVFRELLMGNAIHRNEDVNVADAVAATGVVIANSKSGIWRRISLGSAKQKLSTISLSVSESQFTDNPNPDVKGYLNQVGSTSYLFIALSGMASISIDFFFIDWQTVSNAIAFFCWKNKSYYSNYLICLGIVLSRF